MATFDNYNKPQKSIGLSYGVAVLRLSLEKGRVTCGLMDQVKYVFLIYVSHVHVYTFNNIFLPFNAQVTYKNLGWEVPASPEFLCCLFIMFPDFRLCVISMDFSYKIKKLDRCKSLKHSEMVKGWGVR